MFNNEWIDAYRTFSRAMREGFCVLQNG